MVKRIKVKNVEEFEDMLQEQDLKISKAIIEVALKNLKGKKRFIPVLEVHVEEDESIFDITLDRQNMLSTLRQNLEIHERNEDYEGCEFYCRGKEIKLRAGDILLFPSNFMYPHEVKEATKGTRYSFVSWAF